MEISDFNFDCLSVYQRVFISKLLHVADWLGEEIEDKDGTYALPPDFVDTAREHVTEIQNIKEFMQESEQNR